MFRKYKEKELDIKEVNQTVGLLHKILKIGYVLAIILGIYALTLIGKEWGILTFIKTIIKVLIPFFIGLVIAWLFNPIVTYLHNKKINRVLGSVIVYLLFIGFLFLIIYSIIPVLLNQTNDLVSSVPSLIKTSSNWLNGLFNKFSGVTNINIDGLRDNVFNYISTFGSDMVNTLPTRIMTFASKLISGVGTFGLGLIIGFYMLLNFDNVSKTLISFLPKKIRKDTNILLTQINQSLFQYVKGTFLVSLLIFVTNYIGFLLIGVKAPLFFALFCGITNIIPYAGPYIGAIPVSLVALSQDTTMGVLVIIYIACIQTLEGNFLQPVVMSKTMKLHPVTILLGLLIFGHFFGIVGMIVATPLIAVIKTIFIFFDKKFNLTKYQDEN